MPAKLKPQQREEIQERILDAAASAAEAHGIDAMTRKQVAELAGVATGTVTNYGGDMSSLRQRIVQRAVQKLDGPFLSIVVRHPVYGEMLSPEARRAARLALLS